MLLLGGIIFAVTPPFEPPNVVAEIDSGEQAGLTQSYSIAIDHRQVAPVSTRCRRDCADS